MNILMGYKIETKEGLVEIKNELKASGLDVEKISSRNLKASVEQFVFENAESVDVVVLSEYLETTSPYTVDDIVKLTDIKDDLIIIPLISDEHKGDSYVRALYNAGFYNAMYQADALISKIGELAAKPRSKRDARVYYGILADENDSGAVNLQTLFEYVKNSVEGELIARIEYCFQRLSKKDFTVLLSRLSDSQKKYLSSQGLYLDYLGNVDKKGGFSINMPSINIGKKTEEKVFVEIKNEIIAVISLNKGAGASFISLNLAKAIADKTGLVPAYMHLPCDEDVYEELGLNKFFKNKFYGHLQEIYNGNAMSDMRNVYKGVAVICEDKDNDVLTGWDRNNSLTAMYNAPNPTILDLGDSFDNEDVLSLLPYCGTVICVLDSEADVNDVCNIREFLGELSGSIRKYVVFNKCNEKNLENKPSYLGDNLDYLVVERYNESILKDLFLVDKVSIGGLEKLIGMTTYSDFQKVTQKSGKKGFFENFFKKKTSIVGTAEVAVAGITRGSGATYTAVLLASALAKKYKVALIEQNNHGHFENMSRMVKREYIVSNMGGFTHNGVDYFYNCSYKEFASQLKDQYNFVIIDYGSDKEFDYDSFLRAGVRIVVAPSADWTKKLIDDYYEDCICTIDKNHSFNIVVPFKQNKELDDIRGICRNKNAVYAMPCEVTPYSASVEAMKLFEKLLGGSVKLV